MAAAREEGLLKLVITDPREDLTLVVKSFRTQYDFPDAAKTNLTLAPYLPYNAGGRTLKKDWKIQVQMKSDAADTLDDTDMADCW